MGREMEGREREQLSSLTSPTLKSSTIVIKQKIYYLPPERNYDV